MLEKFSLKNKNVIITRAVTHYFIKIPNNEIISDINKKDFFIGKRFK